MRMKGSDTFPAGPREEGPVDPACILIVDDEPFNLDVLEQELEHGILASGPQTARKP